MNTLQNYQTGISLRTRLHSALGQHITSPLLRVGGATLVDFRAAEGTEEGHVLCILHENKSHPYVVWTVYPSKSDDPRNKGHLAFEQGSYLSCLGDAVARLNERSGRRFGKQG